MAACDPDLGHLLELLEGGRYPVRNVEQNLADLKAQVAYLTDRKAVETEQAEALQADVDELTRRLEESARLEAGLEDIPVPPLILQPLVENAVLHGRDTETGEGDIRVAARSSSNRSSIASSIPAA